MTHAELEHFRQVLVERSRNIGEWMQTSPSVPYRDLEKLQNLLHQMTDALGRIHDESYGVCKVCHDPVEQHRLEIQPVSEVCLACISPEEQAQLEEELFLASKIHRALLPQSMARIDGFDIAVKSLAPRYVGGDYYDFLEEHFGLSRIVIGDVMGKGLPAGLLMSNLQGALRVLAQDIAAPAQLLARLNRWLCRNVPITKFVSMAMIGIQSESNGISKLVYANGGHCPPILLRTNGGLEILEPTGGILGVHEDFTYEEHDCELAGGDTVVLYTDGIVETTNAAGEMFGEERLHQYLSRYRDLPAQPMIDGVIESVLAFSGKPEIDDDLTMIVLRRI